MKRNRRLATKKECARLSLTNWLISGSEISSQWTGKYWIFAICIIAWTQHHCDICLLNNLKGGRTCGWTKVSQATQVCFNLSYICYYSNIEFLKFDAEYLGSQHVEPGLKWLQQFVTRDLQDVMSLDALESSHPISVVVHHPNEINEIFDRISYGKGATIIRMLAAFLGEKTFRQGLTNYLKSR